MELIPSAIFAAADLGKADERALIARGRHLRATPGRDTPFTTQQQFDGRGLCNAGPEISRNGMVWSRSERPAPLAPG